MNLNENSVFYIDSENIIIDEKLNTLESTTFEVNDVNLNSTVEENSQLFLLLKDWGFSYILYLINLMIKYRTKQKINI